MLCAVFSQRLAYLEGNKPMRLSAVTRSARRARKAFALAAHQYGEAETEKARRKAARRTNAARRALIEAERAADWLDYADA